MDMVPKKIAPKLCILCIVYHLWNGIAAGIALAVSCGVVVVVVAVVVVIFSVLWFLLNEFDFVTKII